MIQLETLVGFVLGFVLGSVVGYIARDLTPGEVRENYRLKIAAVITAVWIVSVVAGILSPAYTTPIYVHGIMGMAVGYLFGVENPLRGLAGGKK